MHHQKKIALALISCTLVGLPTLGCRTETIANSSEQTEHTSAHWSYAGATGPEHWGDLSVEYVLCKTGTRQSPINLVSDSAEATDSEVTFEYGRTPLDLTNNGHTIQQTVAPGSSISIRGDRYELLQFHFHSGSEHTLSGERQDLELHLVHQSAAGSYAVVGVLFKRGEKSPFLDSVWKRLPKSAGESIEDSERRLDLAQALPTDRTHFSYDGSFTTPPGTEGVKWLVFREVLECSALQLDSFRALYSGNFRPIQGLNEREVQLRK